MSGHFVQMVFNCKNILIWNNNEICSDSTEDCCEILDLNNDVRKNFAVIDVETNKYHELMSIGACIADSKTFEKIDSRYYILPNEVAKGGHYSAYVRNTSHEILRGNRLNVLKGLENWLNSFEVYDLFAYNASFDKSYLPELSSFCWRDIMVVAANKKYNPHIPRDRDFCSTGKLKDDYGVESMLQILGHEDYRESHVAIEDAMDELMIMKILNHPIDSYPNL